MPAPVPPNATGALRGCDLRSEGRTHCTSCAPFRRPSRWHLVAGGAEETATGGEPEAHARRHEEGQLMRPVEWRRNAEQLSPAQRDRPRAPRSFITMCITLNSRGARGDARGGLSYGLEGARLCLKRLCGGRPHCFF